MAPGQKEAALQSLHDRHAPELRRFAPGSPTTPTSPRTSSRRRCSGRGGIRSSPTAATPRPGAWLFTVTRHIVVDRWRSAAARHETGPVDVEGQSEADRTGEVLDRWLIADALAALSPEHREVIAAAYYEGRSVAEIAGILHIPEGTVKSRLHYGLRGLRLALQEKGVSQP